MSEQTRLKDLAISDTGFVFDPFSGATFTLNPTALCIVQALREGLASKEIVQRLESLFDIVSADLVADLSEFVHALRQHGLTPLEFELK